MNFRLKLTAAVVLAVCTSCHDPRPPDFIPSETMPLHPDPPVAAGGPRTRPAPAKPPQPESPPSRGAEDKPKEPGG